MHFSPCVNVVKCSSPVCRAASLRARRSLNKTLSNQQLSWDSVDGLHLHRENAAATAVSNLDRDEGDALPTEEGNASHEPEQRGKDDEHVLEPQPKCDICGITTTSQAHMEVNTHLSLCMLQENCKKRSWTHSIPKFIRANESFIAWFQQ